MMFLRWALCLPIHLLAVIFRYPLAPFAVIFFTTNDKRQLLFPFRWLDTIDNDLSGDDSWKKEHITGDPLSTWNRIKWLWRNGANSLNYGLLGIEYDPWFSLKNCRKENQDEFIKRSDGAWQYRARVPIFGRVWTPYLGWGLFGNVDGRCKFTATFLRFNKP